MPCGINTMIVTHAYGLDLRLTASAVAWSTAIAVVVATVSSFVV
jgi:predicted permease